MMRVMKKHTRTAAALAAAVMLCGCSASVPESNPEPKAPLEVELEPEYERSCVTPPFWVVEDEETGAQIFLLGSMHAGRSDVKYPEYILKAYRNSSYIAPEMDTVEFTGDIPLQRRCAEYMKLKSGSVSDLLGASFEETLDFFKNSGIYQTGMDKMIPYYWASAASGLITEKAGLDSRYSTETVLLNQAHKDGKEIREIEGGEAQYKMMSEIPLSVQLETLEQCVGDENIALQAESTVELYDAWSSFDAEYFSSMTVFEPTEVENPADWQSYYDMMYTDRQKKMAEFIVDSLKAGEQGFVFVGTMHFYAEPSLITLLKEAGYMAAAIRPAIPAGKTAELPAA